MNEELLPTPTPTTPPRRVGGARRAAPLGRVTKLAIRAARAPRPMAARPSRRPRADDLLGRRRAPVRPDGPRLSTTPQAVGLAIARGEHDRAMPMALCLKGRPHPHRLARRAARVGAGRGRRAAAAVPAAPARLLRRRDRADATCCAAAVAAPVDRRARHEAARAAGGARGPLRALHKAVCTRYDELSKTCHSNLFSLTFLADQLQMATEAAAAGEPLSCRSRRRARVNGGCYAGVESPLCTAVR